ncbi:hypothetical protein [Microvirga tunisiensis]|uniref:Uncharacterized protein n=1 Tax=Microvirga tunisiensis TaxID=2108360 RepID=A0A5N7MMU8_9HYPH|nr:hypothetical protein [Microvirga tunisiensis]MPR10138.1 hypothetical protein [Microvirga tunisiensis]MPR28345.1 hypothetical protein [Microvirga tunisiensis]
MGCNTREENAAEMAADEARRSNRTRHRIRIQRQLIETGTAEIDVPEGDDPAEYLETLRANGDDFLRWSSNRVEDLP